MSYAEIHKVEPDVFDPAGGDRMVIHGRGFSGYTDVRVGVTQATVTSEPMAGTPDLNGTTNKLASPLNADSFLSAAAGTVLVVYRASKLAAAQVQPYADPALIGIDLQYGLLQVNASGVRAALYDGAYHEVTVATSGNATGDLHVAILKWDGVSGYLSVDGSAFSSFMCSSVQLLGSGVLKLGANFNDSNFFGGGDAEAITINATLSDATCLTDLVGYVNKRYGTSFGGTLPSTYDPAVLALTGWWRSNSYAVGTWTATASAGASGGRNLTEATNPPAVADSSILICTAPAGSAGQHPVSVKNASGRTCLANAVEYANPGTIPNCVWWLRPDASAITHDGVPEVTAWADQSGVGDANRNVVPSGTDKPAWNSADPDYSGKPTVGTFLKMGLADDCRMTTGTWNATYTDTAGYFIGVIGDASNSANKYFTYEQSGDYNALLNGSGTPSALGYNATATITGIADLSRPRSLLGATFNAAASKLYVNSNAPVTGDLRGAGPGDTLGDAPMIIGSYNASASTFGVRRIAEVYAYSRALTLREVRTLRRYRDSYYGKVAA